MSSLSQWLLIALCHLILSRSVVPLPVSQQLVDCCMTFQILHFVSVRRAGVVDFRLPAYFVTPPDPSRSELFVVSDSVNKDDNDVTAGDIITLCQPGEQKRALPGLPSCVGSSSRERASPKIDLSIRLSV